jgi:uncharacterized protein YjiS (DUF1127 family)
MGAMKSSHLNFWQRYVAWQDHVYRRPALRNLSDRSLRDIGLSHRNEPVPPFQPRLFWDRTDTLLSAQSRCS